MIMTPFLSLWESADKWVPDLVDKVLLGKAIPVTLNFETEGMVGDSEYFSLFEDDFE